VGLHGKLAAICKVYFNLQVCDRITDKMMIFAPKRWQFDLYMQRDKVD
jgi:hypothetical protein